MSLFLTMSFDEFCYAVFTYYCVVESLTHIPCTFRVSSTLCTRPKFACNQSNKRIGKYFRFICFNVILAYLLSVGNTFGQFNEFLANEHSLIKVNRLQVFCREYRLVVEHLLYLMSFFFIIRPIKLQDVYMCLCLLVLFALA